MLIAELPSSEFAPKPVSDDALYEVIDDRQVEKQPIVAYGSKLANALALELGQFAKVHPLGQAFVEMLFGIRTQPNLNRRPEAAFVSFDRWPRGKRTPSGNAWDVVPDLVVEVVSPTNLTEEIPSKVREYFEAGVRRAWVIYLHESLVYE